jgi:hypothetical protein
VLSASVGTGIVPRDQHQEFVLHQRADNELCTLRDRLLIGGDYAARSRIVDRDPRPHICRVGETGGDEAVAHRRADRAVPTGQRSNSATVRGAPKAASPGGRRATGGCSGAALRRRLIRQRAVVAASLRARLSRRCDIGAQLRDLRRILRARATAPADHPLGVLRAPAARYSRAASSATSTSQPKTAFAARS